MSQWFYAVENERQGPVVVEKLASLLREGRLDRRTMVWQEGMASWQPMDEVESLRALLPTEPPPPPPIPSVPAPPALPPVPPTAAKPNPAAKSALSKKPTRRARLSMLSAAALVLVGVGFGMFRGCSKPVPAGMGIVRVDANPWGEVTSIRSANVPVNLPDSNQRTTPLTLRVGIGNYQIEVVHPPSGRRKMCNVRVRSRETATCWLDLAPVNAQAYFQEIGW